MSSLITDMLSSVKENNLHVGEDMNKSLALSLARNAAIPQGQVLNNEEMENLVNELFLCSNVNYTPDGKPVIAIIQQSEIEHLFNKN